ncbi:MAG: HNH endonuclease [Thermaerobacter sp.]|nr:HNH endonuclease [Thermaerobacter sp.]
MPDALNSLDMVPVVDLGGRPLTPCSPEKAEQNLRDGLATMADGVLRLNYRPLAYRRIYRMVRDRDGLTCAWCHGVGSTLDHVLPICWGGRTALNNCVMACRACNHARNNALPSHFLQWTGFRPEHPVIRYVLEHEDELLVRAEQSLRQRPIATCLSKEEAQIWVACHHGQWADARPAPPAKPFSRFRPDQPFREVFVP